MSEHEPRWRDDPELDEALRALLDAGAAELPHDEQLDRLEARLFPVIPPGGEGGGGPPAALGALSKGALAVVGIAAIAGAIGLATHRPAREPVDELAGAAAPEAAIPHDAGFADDAAIDAGLAPRSDASALDAAASTLAPIRRPASDPAAELAIVQAAQSALSSSPRRALALTQTHARDFPDGALAQEREVIAIDALMRLDRAPAAQRRAARFHERWPSSAHGRRVDVLVAPP